MVENKMKKYFVKFVPFNEGTKDAIANKTIKFSRVTDFNDFNEQRVSTGNKIDDAFFQNEKVISEIRRNDWLVRALSEIKSEATEHALEVIDNALAAVNRPKAKLSQLNQEARKLIYPLLAYYSVGCLSLSSLSVFLNDAAQLMFAHYGDNLKGLALVYEFEEAETAAVLKKIHYRTPIDMYLKSSTPGFKNVVNWVSNIYKDTDLTSFREKSPLWFYENEYRLIFKPGITECRKANLTLKSVFYTTRIRAEDKTELLKLVADNYGNKVEVKKLRPHNEKFRFTLADSDEDLLTYLHEKFDLNIGSTQIQADDVSATINALNEFKDHLKSYEQSDSIEDEVYYLSEQKRILKFVEEKVSGYIATLGAEYR